MDDPLATPMQAAWAQAGASGIVDALFGQHGIIPSPWRPDDYARSTIAAALSG